MCILIPEGPLNSWGDILVFCDIVKMFELYSFFTEVVLSIEEHTSLRNAEKSDEGHQKHNADHSDKPRPLVPLEVTL